MSAKGPELLDCVVLLHDRPELGLVAGQTGTVVHEYDGGAYEVEFVDKDGRTYALDTFKIDELLKLIPTPQAAA